MNFTPKIPLRARAVALAAYVFEMMRENFFFVPVRLFESITTDLNALKRNLLVNTGRDVLLLYGYYGTIYDLLPLAHFLSKQGYKVHIPHYDSLASVQKAAEQVEHYVLELNLQSFVCVGHSKGGIIAKYIASTGSDVSRRMTHIITIASPHKGTILGFLPLPNSQELCVGSPLLSQMVTPEIEKNITAICNTQDLVIIPSSSQKVTYGANRQIDVWGHVRILSIQETAKAILDVLEHT